MDIEAGRRRDARGDRDAARRPARRLSCPSTAGGWRTRPASTPTSCARRDAARPAVRGLPRRGGDARRDQPDRHHARPRGHRAGCEGHARRQRALPPPRQRGADDASDADPQEQMAAERGLTYVKLDGDIGVFGNGAGPRHVHARRRRRRPAARRRTSSTPAAARRPRRSRRRSRSSCPTRTCEAVLFNVFGGITRCDEVARGIIEAYGILSPSVPFVVRLDGTNDVEARKLLADADAARRATPRRRWTARRRASSSSRAEARRHEHHRRRATRGCACPASPAARAPSTR